MTTIFIRRARLTAILDQVRALGEQWRADEQHWNKNQHELAMSRNMDAAERSFARAETYRKCADELTARITEKK